MATKTKITRTSKELQNLLNVKQSEIEIAMNALNNTARADYSLTSIFLEKKKAAQKAVNEWNEIHTQFIYASCYEQENPMLAACRYGAVYEKILVEKRNEHGRVAFEISELRSRNTIDLVDFDVRHNGQKTLFRNRQWINYADEFIKAMADPFKLAAELPREEYEKIKEQYKSAKADNKFFCLTKENPSTCNKIKDLQSIIDMILFIPHESDPDKNDLKIISADIRFLKRRVVRIGKDPYSLRIIKGKETQNAITEILYHRTTCKPYTFQLIK